MAGDGGPIMWATGHGGEDDRDRTQTARRPPPTLFTVAVVALLLAAAPGCRGCADDGTASAPRVFTWVDAPVRSLDPAFAEEMQAKGLVLDLFEGPLVHAPDGGPPRLGAAARLDVSPDGRVYTVHLRPEARWSDGTPVRASDWLFSLERVLRPETASPLVSELFPISGARAYATAGPAGGARFAEVGISAASPLELVIRLDEPTAHFPWVLAGPAFLPVPPHVVRAHGDRWARPEHLVTNGPFRVASWAMGEAVRLERSPTFHGAGDVALSAAALRHVTEPAAALRLFEAGEVQWLPRNVPRDRILAARAAGDARLRTEPALCVYNLELRVSARPLARASVRRALGDLVDREHLCVAVLATGQQPTRSVVPDLFRESLGFVSPEPPRPDAGAALRALELAGYPGGRGLPMLEVLHAAFPAHDRIATFVAESWRRALTTEVRTSRAEWRAMLARLEAGDYQIAGVNWCADYPDPLGFLEIFRSNSPNNRTGFADPELDRLYREIAATPLGPERNALLARAVRRVNEQAPVIPLYAMTRNALVAEGVGGLEPNPLGVHLLRYVSWETE